MDEFGSNSEKLFNNHEPIDKTPEKEVTRVDRGKALILLSAVALIAIASNVVLTAYAGDDGEEDSNGFAGWFNGRMGLRMCEGAGGWRCGRGPYGFIEVSEEYEQDVITIAESDQDVQDLLSDGYSVAGVRLIITTKVEAGGKVVTEATNAIVILEKDTTGRASVWVDLEEGKVTKIAVLTRTVIEKT